MESQETTEAFRPLVIARRFEAAQGIWSFELVDGNGALLPPFTAGSHIRVRVPSGDVRKYSLCNDPNERHRYLITVKRDATGRGGSVSLVDSARVGDVLLTSSPENAFALEAAADEYLFIAGGIGITPILAMIRSLGEEPLIPWKLIYLSRSREVTAFYEELTTGPFRDRVQIHHTDGDPRQTFDLWPVLERPSRAHVYCCGPRTLMECVRDMTGHWLATRIHFESFTEGGTPRPDDRPFTIRLARSGRVLEVPVGKTILSVLREAQVPTAFSCESGTCGTCKTRLLEGEADHRDMVLMPEEQGTRIMICVSRAQSESLTLDA